MDLSGNVALVTGANRGIGRAIAEELATRPLDLVLVGTRSLDNHEPLEPPPGGAKEVRPVVVDLSSREAVERSWAGLADEPPIDLLVNNAGQLSGGLLEEQDVDEIYSMFQVNLVGLVDLTRRAAAGDARARARQDREQRQHQRLRVAPGRDAPTPPPRPASSRSASRCGAS